MLEKELVSLCRYRLDKARQCLVSAKNTMYDGDYAISANRSYYAIFHGIRAILALEPIQNLQAHPEILNRLLDSLDFKKHSAVISKFREMYIKTGIFDTVYFRIIGEAFDLRSDCDYEDFYLVTKAEVEVQIKNGAQFLDAVESYIEKRIAAS